MNVFSGQPFEPRPDLFVPTPVDPRGATGPTRKRARGSGFRRTSQGFYVPASADAASPEQRIVEAVPFLGGRNALTGWAAMRWLGAAWFGGTTAGGTMLAPVPVLLKSDHAPQPGFLFSEERTSFTTIFEHDGLAVTDPWRSTCFEMRYARNVREAVVALDMACQADLVSLDEMTAYLVNYNGWTGIPQARQALPLAVENSWSPQEVRMRLVWELDCGFPRPRCNVPIFDLAGKHLLTPDLFDQEAGVVGEYDGSLHLEGSRRRRDRDRQELASDHGLEWFTVMAGDLGTARCTDRMIAARSRGLFEQPERRRWTIDPPYWWTPTLTVEQRRRLDDEQRTRWLGQAG